MIVREAVGEHDCPGGLDSIVRCMQARQGAVDAKSHTQLHRPRFFDATPAHIELTHLSHARCDSVGVLMPFRGAVAEPLGASRWRVVRERVNGQTKRRQSREKGALTEQLVSKAERRSTADARSSLQARLRLVRQHSALRR